MGGQPSERCLALRPASQPPASKKNEKMKKNIKKDLDLFSVHTYTRHKYSDIENTMVSKPLTEQQKSVLKFVQGHLAQHGFPPTMREIGQGIGIANVNAVRGHLAALEKKGYIAKEADKARSIRVLHTPSAFSRFRHMLHEVARTDEGVVSRVVYGLAWVTTRRRPILGGQAKELIEEAFERECVEHGWRLLEKEARPDHVRLIVEVWPNHSPELTVRRFKWAANAARRRVMEQFPEKRLWGRGYVVTTDLSILDGLIEQMLDEQETK